MNDGFRVKIVSDLAELSGLRDEWLRLANGAAGSNTFLTPEWQLSWLEAYHPAAVLQAVCAYRGDELVGLAPVMIQREKCLGVPLRCLRFVGDGTFESDHLDFVLRADLTDELRPVLLESLGGLDWDTAVFSNVPESSPTRAALRDWATRNRFHVEESLSPCPVRPIPESFDALLASMPSRFRTAIRSTRRKLAAAYEIEFGLHEDPAGFETALQALFANHESRWTARGESGVFVNERRREFYRLLTPRLFEAGALRFFYLKLDGRIVAQEYCFQHDGVVYLLQEGFDFALAKENIGNALRSYVFDYLIEHKYRAYDFLAGVTRHKMNWSESAPNDVTLTLSRRSLRGNWAFQAPRVLERVKDRLRPIRDRLRQAGGDSKTTGRDDTR
jgi:CelD/BcsL family acetyltransferase involved in cellulose biosynthesis